MKSYQKMIRESDSYKQYQREWARNKRAAVKTVSDWLSHNWSHIKSSAKKRSIPFDLAIEDVIIVEVCPVFNTKLDPQSENKADRPSLDRIDSSKGYEKGNVRLVSWKANWKKNSLSYEEVKALYETWDKIIA